MYRFKIYNAKLDTRIMKLILTVSTYTAACTLWETIDVESRAGGFIFFGLDAHLSVEYDLFYVGLDRIMFVDAVLTDDWVIMGAAMTTG